MRIFKGFLFFQMALLVLFLACIDIHAAVITLPQLRLEVAKSRQQNQTTAHLVYIEQETNNGPTYEPEGSDTDKAMRLALNSICQRDILLDNRNNRVKYVSTDLRDVNVLVAESGLTARNRMTVSQTRTILVCGSYVMIFYEKDSPQNVGHILFMKENDPGFFFFNILHFGIMNEELLNDDKNPRLAEVDTPAGRMLRVDIAYFKSPNLLEATIDCDPKLGYRYRSIRWRRDGKPFTETIADDYKDVNGIPYPFSYTERWFNKDGILRKESVYQIESAEFGVSLCDDDFKVFVPAGTEFHDLAVSTNSNTLGSNRNMGIDEALAVARMLLQKP